MGRKSRQKKERRQSEEQPQQPKHTPEKAIAAFRADEAQYLTRWATNAQQFQGNHDYGWMSSFFLGYHKILEVGTGAGHSTLQLLRDGHSVVSVEHNQACIKAAQSLIRSHGFGAEVDLRVRAIDPGCWPFHFEYAVPRNAPRASGAMILEADVLNDPRLVEWLREVGPFDGVACWLVGSHGLRSLYMNEDGTTVRKPTLYRLQVQNRVYELADSILRPGGILHVVDRGTMPSDEEKKRSLLESHREQASPTSLVVESADWRPVESFDTPGGVKMEPGEVSRKDPPERVEWAFESVISRKLDVGMLK